jgi:uncharacterized membrane protein
MINHHKDSPLTSEIRHLGRLSDIIFALAMALTILGFQLPESAETMTAQQVNKFLLDQLEPLGTYAISLVTVAFYWIDHIQQFKHYRKTNDVLLWLGILYLMCLFLVPYSNALSMSFPNNLITEIWFSINIFLIGFLSFLSWMYATHKHQLVDPQLDSKTIAITKWNALAEPMISLLAIGVALIDPKLWDFVWILLPIPYILISKFMGKAANTISDSDLNIYNKSGVAD